jgi:hypothetical protein
MRTILCLTALAFCASLTNTDLMPSDPRPAFIALFRTGEDAVATRPLPEAEPCPTTDRSPGTATKKSPA